MLLLQSCLSRLKSLKLERHETDVVPLHTNISYQYKKPIKEVYAMDACQNFIYFWKIEKWTLY